MNMSGVRLGVRGAFHSATAGLLITFIGGCGAGDSTGTGGSTGFVGDGSTLTVAPASLTIAQGHSETATLTLVRNGSAAQQATVTIVIPSLSKGLTATFDPASLTPGVSSTTVTFAAAVDADIVAKEQPFFVPLVGTDTLGLSGNAPSLTLSVRNGRPGVAVQKAGTGTGTVTSTPAGIDCGNTCSAQFEGLTPITLTAVPSAGSAFTSWAGLCTGTALTCTFTPNDFGNVVTATFTSTAPAIALSVSPSPVSVQAGASAAATVTLTRINGFADPVNLVVTAPTGLTVTANPASITGSTSTLTVSAGASLAAGNYPVTITGTGTGVTPQTVTFAVQVTPGSSGGAIAFNFASCETNQIPVWFAVQDGSGPWTRLTPTNNAFTFTINSVGAIATVVKDGTSMQTSVLYGSAAEIAAIAIANPCGGAPTGTKRLTGPFANYGDSTSVVSLVIGGAQYTKPANTGGFTMTNVPQGPRDLIATRTSVTAPGTDRMVLRRGTNYPTNTNIPTIDFGLNSAESFATVFGGVVIPNLGTDQGGSEVSLITVNGPSASYYSYSDTPRPNVGFPYVGLPESQLQAGDFHDVSVFALPPSSNGTAYRFIRILQHSPSVQTISLGPPLGVATKVTTLGATPYLRLRAQIPTQSTYTAGATAQYFQNANSFEILMSAAYLGSPPASWTLDMPDLSGGGYNSAWALSSGTGVSWGVNAVSGNILPFVGGNPVDNAQILGAGVQDSAAMFTSAVRRRVGGRWHP